MIKKSVYAYVFWLFLFGIAFVTSCIVDGDDDNRLTEPTIYLNTNGTAYDISFAPIENMRYANIFREKSADDFSTITETVNIGQVVPSDLSTLPSAFVFEDVYMNDTTDEAYKYRYFIRFWDNAAYTYTKKSTVLPSINGAEEEAHLKNKTLSDTYDNLEKVSFLYVKNDYETEKDYSLYLTTEVWLPIGFEELHVVIGIKDKTTKRPFLFAVGDKDATDYVAIPAVTSKIDLQKTLPSTFLDTKLFISEAIGVVKIGYKTDDTNIKNNNYTNFYWTTPATVVADTTDDENPGYIQYAWRNDEGTWYPEQSNSTITDVSTIEPTAVQYFEVPSITDPENEFDYSLPDYPYSAMSPRTLVETNADGVELDFTPYTE